MDCLVTKLNVSVIDINPEYLYTKDVTSLRLKDAYFAVNETTDSVDETFNLTGLTNSSLLKISCKQGNIFTLSGCNTTQSSRFYVFLNENKNVLECASQGFNGKVNIQAPAGSKTLLITNYGGTTLSVIFRSKIDRYIECYQSTAMNTDENRVKPASTNYTSFVVEVASNDTLFVSGNGGASPRLWAFYDKNSNRLSVSDANAVASDVQLTVPNNAVMAVFNFKNGTDYSIKLNGKEIAYV